MREPESLEEQASMVTYTPVIENGQIVGVSINPPEYQHPEEDNFNPYWEQAEWLDAATWDAMQYEEGMPDDDNPADTNLPGQSGTTRLGDHHGNSGSAATETG
jgi:hypothetical protein